MELGTIKVSNRNALYNNKLSENPYKRKFSDVNNSPNFNGSIAQKAGENCSKVIDSINHSSLSKKAGNAIANMMDKFERGGFLLELLVVDFCGLIMPRTIQAYNRNKQELGHPNYKAAIEEFLREMLAGPMMIAIPMATVHLGSKLFGDSTFVPLKIADSLKDVHQKTLNDSIKAGMGPKNKEIAKELRKSFFNNIASNIFEKHNKSANNSGIKIPDEINKLADQFEELYQLKYVEGKKDKKAFKELGKEISKNISRINSLFGFTENTHAINIAKKSDSTKINTFVKDIVNYTNGTVEKVNAHVLENIDNFKEGKALKEVIDHAHNTIKGARKSIVMIGTLALGAFLYSAPKIYQRYKQYPGLNGLVDENETCKTPTIKANDISGFDMEKTRKYFEMLRGGAKQ